MVEFLDIKRAVFDDSRVLHSNATTYGLLYRCFIKCIHLEIVNNSDDFYRRCLGA